MRFRHRLIGVFLAAALLGSWIVADVWSALERVQQADEGERGLIAALRLHQDADMMHDAIRADVFGTMLGHPEAATELDGHIDALRADLAALETLNVPEPGAGAIAASRGPLLSWVSDAEALARLATTDPAAAVARIPAFSAAFDAVVSKMADTTEALALARTEAADGAAAERGAIRFSLAWHIAVAVATVCLAIAAVGGQGLAALARIREVAARLSGGELSARNATPSSDEIGDLARTFNELGDSLQVMADRSAAEAEKMRFAGQLAEALEMAETERDVVEVAQIALAASAGAGAGSSALMLADSSRAKLKVVTQADTHACGVESPWACVAMRRATVMTFPSSTALDACPRLRGGETCSAVCVPVNFTGRAIGVLRTTAAPGSTEAESVSRLTTIANQTGARIGAIRAMDRAKLQASTDALTGLVNRRTLEARVLQIEGPYAVIMADLDHFKKLNDTFGHQAGDHALRLFGQTVRNQQRATDIACRYGGEEFVIVLPASSAADAMGTAERIRGALASASTGTTPPFTVSCGVSDSTMEASFDDILRAADGALYTAKSRGRDQAVIAGTR